MRTARPFNFIGSITALVCAIAILSCGGDSTGPGGGNGVTVTPNPDTVALGSTVTLHATVDGASGSPSFFWSSENASVATVSGTGVVTGVSLGSARIAASSGGKSGVATVVVIPPGVASVRVTPSLAPITVGGTVHLQAQPLDASGSPLDGRSVTWSSDNEAVATVDDAGVVTGVSTGTANVTATSEGKTGTAGINVGAAVAASITVAPPSVTVTTGQSSQLTATVKDASGNVISGAPVSWNVDNSGTALVSSTGLVAGQSAGTATVTATSGAAHVNVAVTVTPPTANAVIVSPSTVALLITQQQQLTGTVTDAGGHTIPGQPITWQSNNTLVATVSSSGLVSAVLPGSAIITATSGSVSGDAQVTVTLVPVRRVTVTPDALSFTQGEPGTQLTVALLDSSGGALAPAGHPVTFSSNNSGVATVSGTGFVTPGGSGQAVVTVTVTGTGISTTSTVNVAPVSVASVIITPSPDTLAPSQSVQLTAKTLDASGNTLSGRTVVWDGSDDGVALVSSAGKVVAQSSGTMTVTATSEGKTGTATIVVTVPVASVTIAPTTQSVDVGSTVTFVATPHDASNNALSGRTIIYSSSDPTIATINSSTGVATGVAPGSVTIGAISEGKTGTASLTVNPVAVSSVKVSPPAQTIVDGGTATFSAELKDAQGNTLSGRVIDWSTSDPNVATVDNTGVATSTGPGTATITATSDGQSGSATLEVDPAPVSSVQVSPPVVVASVGDNVQFTATVDDAPPHGHGHAVAWSSSDESLAVVDNKGKMKALALGLVTITATSQDQSGFAAVTILP